MDILQLGTVHGDIPVYKIQASAAAWLCHFETDENGLLAAKAALFDTPPLSKTRFNATRAPAPPFGSRASASARRSAPLTRRHYGQCERVGATLDRPDLGKHPAPDGAACHRVRQAAS